MRPHTTLTTCQSHLPRCYTSEHHSGPRLSQFAPTQRRAALHAPQVGGLWAAAGRRVVDPQQQVDGHADSVQPGAVGRRVLARLVEARPAHEATRGPLAVDDAAAAATPGTEGDDEDESALCSLLDIAAALEEAGVAVDFKGMTNKRLGSVIRLPLGGASGSTQRATLREGGAAIVRGIASSLNPDGSGTASLIAAALVPPPPLETRQRVAADRAVTESLVRSYLDAVKRKLPKREQRQRLSALVPTIGQHGYTLPMLKRELNINISRCAARARLC